jgi:class 3 adenylate cyclase/tetratricopeptide (TPR) repeat protein
MGDAAVETVTILITDLVGSTQLESRVGPIVAEELRQEHFGLLRKVVDEAGGREVKNTGDGLMVAFDSAAAAVSCTVSVQQRFERRNRSEAEPLLIKAGLSSGDATTAEGDVFGMPVIEAARLCERCAAGQILAKDLVAHLAAGRGHTFASLGALEFKGLSEPMSTVEVRWEPAPATGIALPERLRGVPATGYVGRVGERERLTQLWAEACQGSLSLAVISGEAGVGKTRLATHMAVQVQEEGSTVLYGRCDEDLGVPYQPWVQALGYLATEARRQILEDHVQRFGGELVRLVPALGDRLPDVPPARQSDPETERYLLYAAAADLLEAGGRDEPLMLILDDLHWADAPTLSLLRHVISAGPSMRVMVVMIYRETDLSRDHPLVALLADLHRERGGERMKLAGLESADVFALMQCLAGHELGDNGRELAQEITRETAGNPFFAGELLRHLVESGALVHADDGRWRLVGDLSERKSPQSVRQVIGRRVERLGSDARPTLSAAAVIGRDFDLGLLRAVVELHEATLVDLLDEAVRASLLFERSGRAGQYSFTHALVEKALYEDLGHARRALLHRQVAEALEEQCGGEPGERLGELAAHWVAAAVSTDAAKAIYWARLAAEHALAKLAPPEALRWYSQALELHDQSPGLDRSERCELLIGLGVAQRQTGRPEFRQTLLDAARLAQTLGDTDRLSRAVLANGRGWIAAYQFGAVDAERVRALEAAAEALSDDDPRLPRVLALMAYELHHGGEPARCRSLAENAIEKARASGDRTVLAHTLANATAATWGTDALRERERTTHELFELVQRLDDPQLTFWAALRRVVVGMQIGEPSQVEAGLATMRTLATSVPRPLIVMTRLRLESNWALVRGDLKAAEQWATEAREAATASGEPDGVLVWTGQLSRIRYFQGDRGELLEGTLQQARGPGSLASWRAAAALGLIAGDRADEARELVLAADFQAARLDETWLMATMLWAEACTRLRVVARASELYELLAPFSGQFLAGGTIVSGPIDWALGVLATMLERYEEAEKRLASAAELERRLGAPLFVARTRVSWAEALIARGRRADLERARPMLEDAEDRARRSGADGIARQAARNRAALAELIG